MRRRPTYTVTDFESPSPSSHWESQPHGTCLTVVPKAHPGHTLHRTTARPGSMAERWTAGAEGCGFLRVCRLCGFPGWSSAGSVSGGPHCLSSPLAPGCTGSHRPETPCALSAPRPVSACPGQGHDAMVRQAVGGGTCWNGPPDSPWPQRLSRWQRALRLSQVTFHQRVCKA